ncbi:hypothetical protein SDC9_79338 [bioreactor metagenome]|uniref:Glycosaminoglycan attachment site n=1 Tax=bioreactor metagenome TaxID=1076179 RepID=A0A644Z220_9ZZZZ
MVFFSVELELFENPNHLEHYHPKFLLLSNPEMYYDCERRIVKSWTDGFIDRDNKIVKEFRSTFHSAFWEFYLHALFKNAKYSLDQSHNRPDFIITNSHVLYVEAVTSNIKKNGKSESLRGMNDILSMVTPPWAEPTFYKTLDEAIIRLSNSIKVKYEKVKREYKKCSWVDETAPFALAISSYDQINYGREYIYPMMALLYGLYYNTTDNSFSKKTSIRKAGTNSDIPLGLFLDSSHEEISGILFSCTHTLGKLEALANSKFGVRHQLVYDIRYVYTDTKMPYKLQFVDQNNPEYLEDGLFLFHNPHAKNKIPLEMFDEAGVYQITYENDKILGSPGMFPLVARISFDKHLDPIFSPYIKQQIMLFNRKE